MLATSVVYPVELIQGRLGIILKTQSHDPDHRRLPSRSSPGRASYGSSLHGRGPVSVVLFVFGWLVFHVEEFQFAENTDSSDPFILFDHVWKEFRRGERHDILRDMLPALAQRVFRGTRNRKLHAGDFWALRDVSFEVKPGMAWVLSGPMAAGKINHPQTAHKARQAYAWLLRRSWPQLRSH